MKTSLRYLRYGLEKSLWRTVIFTAISVTFTLITVRSNISVTEDRYKTAGLYMLAVLISVFAAIIPMLELSEFKNRRNLDTLYFFPIERKSMALVHFVSGFIQLAVIYTVTFATHFGYLLVTTDCFSLGYMIPYYFATLAIGLVMYSFFCFTFSQGNTVADGVIISLLWAFVGYVVLATLFQEVIGSFAKIGFSYDNVTGEATYNQLYKTYLKLMQLYDWGNVFAPISNTTTIFTRLVESNRYSEMQLTKANGYARQWYMFAAWGGVGVATAIGYVVGFCRRGAQMAGEISSSWFAYKTLIPIYGYSLLLSLATNQSIDYLLVLIAVMMIIGYVIYRRSFRLKKSDVIVLVCGIIPIIMGYMLGSL